MIEYSIVFAPTAEGDLESIISWINQHAPHKTSEWLASLRIVVNTLQCMPERCPYAPENGLWGNEELRQLLFQQYPSQYRIIFTIHQTTVRILNIRHSARRYLHQQ